MLATAGFGSSVLSSSVERFSWERLVTQSEVVFRGRCSASQAYLDPKTGIIWTRYEFQVSELFKGSPSPDWTVTEPGGMVTDMGHVVPGAPHFDVGNEVVLFLYRTELGRWRTRGLGQGHFQIYAPLPAGRPRVRQVLRGIELVEPSQDRIAGGVAAPIEGDLERFLEHLRRSVAATRGLR